MVIARVVLVSTILVACGDGSHAPPDASCDCDNQACWRSRETAGI
jgi:hypothetical protein